MLTGVNMHSFDSFEDELCDALVVLLAELDSFERRVCGFADQLQREGVYDTCHQSHLQASFIRFRENQ